MARTVYGTLVGIDAYRAPVPALRGCVNDIEAVSALLREFSKGDDFLVELQTLENDRARRADVIKSFREHLCKAGPEDVALFYYSGHGSQEDAPQEFWHLEPDRLDETLVCYDSRDPGQWDLADKELALLIAEVAVRGAHVLCVLDCCHSGSGTRAALDEGIAVRRAPTDRRHRQAQDFLDGVLKAATSRTEESPVANWGVAPGGKHVLLAACRSSETAKEVLEGGKSHGALTAALLTILQQTRGSITYRDLAKRAEAQVRLRVAQQVPQIETSDVADLQRLFLGGAIQKQQAHFTLRFDKELDWVVDGGAIHGIPRPKGGETTVFSIFDSGAKPDQWRKTDSALAIADVEQVRPELSQVKLKLQGPELSKTQTYRAITIATPLPALGVHLAGDVAMLEPLRAALKRMDGPSLLVQEEPNEEGAALRVDGDNGRYRISRARAERPLVAEVVGTSPDAARLVVERLEHIARWEAVAHLKNEGSQLGIQPVELTLLLPVSDGKAEAWKEADPGKPICLTYVRDGSKWKQPRLRIQVTNRSDRDIYCALIWLGEDYSISSVLLPGGVALLPKKGGSIAANNGDPLYGLVPLEKWKEGRTEVTDLIKVIVSTDQFDPTLFDQPALDRYAQTRSMKGLSAKPRNALDRLAQRVHVRAIGLKPEGEDAPDWAASDFTLTVVRPLDAADVPLPGQEAKLGAGVTLMGHSSLKARVSLESPAEAGRALGHVGVPAVFRDSSETTSPFEFEAARGTDPGLTVLQLAEVANAESVSAENPLRLQVQAQLGAEVRVVPYAWDGEFYLPLGSVRRTGAGVEIELRQLTTPLSTVRDLERGFVSSIRIMFQKIVSPFLGTDYDYPHLAAVTFDGAEQPVYQTAVEAVRQRVSPARKILLFVHGILGDTLGMTASSKAGIAQLAAPAQRIADGYDLVLAFDYENIKTDLETTARDLKARLAAVGLGPDHGKTLHIAAHSMGGLVSRWFIEREGGNRVIQYLVTLGTPHAGSPWPTIEGWATSALAIGLNGLGQVAWPAKLLGDLAGAIETVDVALDQMEPGSPFLGTLSESADPQVPYTLLVGNTSIISAAVANGTLAKLLSRLSPQRVLHSATSLAFFGKPNDIAVGVPSAQSVPTARKPTAVVTEVACDHITFFTSDAGRQALLEALRRP